MVHLSSDHMNDFLHCHRRILQPKYAININDYCLKRMLYANKFYIHPVAEKFHTARNLVSVKLYYFYFALPCEGVI